MTQQLIFTLLASSAVAGIVTTVITTAANRRNLGATAKRTETEATQILTTTAGGLVADLRSDNADLRQRDAVKSERIDVLERRVDDLEGEQRGWEREREDWLRVLQMHVAWDTLAVAKLRELAPDFSLPDPPPLTPPVRGAR